MASNANPAQLQAELELERQKLLKEAIDVACARQELDISLHEYNKAHGLNSTALTNPSRVGEVRNRGRNLNAEIARDGRGVPAASASFASALRPKYNTLPRISGLLRLQPKSCRISRKRHSGSSSCA